MSEDKQGLPTFGVALDPFRPTEVLTPPGVAQAPPFCPSPSCVVAIEITPYFLYVNNVNAKGDVLLTCLNCGYETVYRVATNIYEPRPGRSTEGWKPPILDLGKAKKIARGEIVEVPVKRGAGPTRKAARAGKKKTPPAVDKPSKAAVDSGPDMAIKEAVEQSKKSLDTIYEAIRLKRLKAFKRAGKTFIRHQDLMKYLEQYPARV